MFFGESMFSRETRRLEGRAGAAWSSAALALGIDLIDCQLPSPHLRSLGSRAIPRREFLALLRRR